MAGISKLRTNNYSDYNEFRLWCLRNAPQLLMDFCEPCLSYWEWYWLQKEEYRKMRRIDIEAEEISLVIAGFLSNTDKYLYWHCPLDFVREYLETQCGYKKASWFVKLFWKY